MLNKLHTNITTICCQRMLMQHLAYESSCLIQSGTEDLARQLDIGTDEEDNVHINLSGKYEIEVTPEIIEKMETDQTIDVVWLTGNAKKMNSRKYKLEKELVQCLARKYMIQWKTL